MNIKKLMVLAAICVAAASPSLAGLVARWDFNNYDPSNPTSAAIPSGAFTAAQGDPNCVAFIAYDSSGDVVARNSALVTQGPSESTTIFLR